MVPSQGTAGGPIPLSRLKLSTASDKNLKQILCQYSSGAEQLFRKE